jgi:competence protein ComEA
VRHENIKKLFEKSNSLDRFLFLIILIGSVIAAVSLFRGILMDRQVQVEYLSGGEYNNNEANSKIFIDIEGAVISPGVYELIDGSRIKDVLVMAGGLSEGANREFCEKNINMAEILKDGQKIYIPFLENTNAQQGYMEASLSSKKVSINSATVSELDTLWGIGSARAESIVKNRPYQSVEELVTKGVLTKSLLDKNRELLSVY